MWSWMIIALTACVVMVLIGKGSLSKKRLDAAKARELVKKGATLVDVRSPQEFYSGHLDGALNLPMDRFAHHAPEEFPSPDATIIVYCRSGMRSLKAKMLLEELGYRDVHDLGAISNW